MKVWSIFTDTKSKTSPRQASAGASSSGRKASSPNSLRRELVTVALRSTLTKHGIPPHWIGIEIQSALSSQGEFHSYVKLLVKHWEPALLQYTVAFQNSLAKRIFLLDTTAHSWLRSIGWQFSVPDEKVCPIMPPSQKWEPSAEIELAVSQLPSLKSQLEKLSLSMADDDERRFGSHDFQQTEPQAHAVLEPETPSNSNSVALLNQAMAEEDARQFGSADFQPTVSFDHAGT